MDLEQLKNFDIKSIDLKNFGQSPLPIKIAAIVLACAAVLIGGYYLFLDGQWENYKSLEKREEELRNTFLDKKALAINLAVYKQQMEEMEQTFGTMRRQLPSSTEIPDLLIDITQAGLGRGLEFVLFKPEKEKPVDFYAELPISIKVNGSYHELGQFMSDVAALPRIVTLGDIAINAPTDKSNKLTMSVTAKTYRYMESETGIKPIDPKVKK